MKRISHSWILNYLAAWGGLMCILGVFILWLIKYDQLKYHHPWSVRVFWFLIHLLLVLIHEAMGTRKCSLVWESSWRWTSSWTEDTRTSPCSFPRGERSSPGQMSQLQVKGRKYLFQLTSLLSVFVDWVIPLSYSGSLTHHYYHYYYY